MAEVITYQGGAVRASDDGSVRGWLVPFGSPERVDSYGTYFHPDTDFGSMRTSVVLYHHGLDPDVGRRVFDEDATLDVRDEGVWIEAKLDTNDPFARRMLRMVEAGGLGWSSGTAPHLIEQEDVGGAIRVDRWPLGLDGSLTPMPANTDALAMRSATRAAQKPPTRHFFDLHLASEIRQVNQVFSRRAALARHLRKLNTTIREGRHARD